MKKEGTDSQPKPVPSLAQVKHNFRALHPQVRAVFDDLKLTTAEKRVIRCTVRGMREPEIRRTLNITDSTLRTHKCSAYHKLNVTTQLEAVTSINRLALKRQDVEIARLRNVRVTVVSPLHDLTDPAS